MNFDLKNIRTLVVDDNVHMRRILRTLLHTMGGRNIIEAEDGANGLDIYRTQSPDLIITDYAMPILNGLEMVQMIRRPDAPNPYIPILMVSSFTEKHRVISARDAGVNEFLKKPISATLLYERLYLSLVEPRPFIKAQNYFGPCRRRNHKTWTEADKRGSGQCEIIEVEPLIKIAA